MIGDGEVSVTGSEAATIITVVAALRISASGEYDPNMDANDDGVINSLDALKLLQMVARST